MTKGGRMKILATVTLFALAAITVEARAQEVAYVDVTNVIQRTQRRVPPPPEGTNGGFVGGAVGDCGIGNRDPRALRTTLTWLNALRYQAGDPIAFEAKIENVGKVPIAVAVSPHLSDLQPADAALQFAYSEIGIQVALRNGAVSLSYVMLYGNEEHPGTLARLQPGEWIRVRAQGILDGLEQHLASFSGNEQTLEMANARIWLHQSKFLPHPGGSSTNSEGVCIPTENGPDMSVSIVRDAKKTAK